MTWKAIAAGASAALAGNRGGGAQRRAVDMLCASYGATDVLLTDSGTSALRLAIAGAVAGDDRPVALPGYGCFDLASAAEGAGARVLLYDLDPHTLGPSTEWIERLAALNPAAIVVACLFGYPIDMESLRSALGETLVIEDAAQGVGGSYRARPLGSLGSVSILSFGRGKGLTSGGGGALLGLDERGAALVARAREKSGLEMGGRGARQMAALAGQHLLGRPALYGIPASLPFLHLGETTYHPPRAPRGPTAASLAVLERTLQMAEEETRSRVQNANRLFESLTGTARVVAVPPAVGEPGYLRLPALVRTESAGRVLGTAEHRLGVTAGYPHTLAALPSLAGFLVNKDTPLPGSELLAQRLVTLPTHSLLTEEDLARIERWVLQE